MKRLMLLAALGSGLAVAGCEDPVSQQAETAPPPIEAPVAPAATDQGVAAADTTAPTDTPPNSTLPSEERSSEETVKPESETLFY
ncbi:hypothetical protein [Brevundimonas sp.]|uniref:hypothetical protein n=1 Tax=Brevundimonas sp. TaxID=1871086 RepID=UPI00286B7C6F|nr:hypothetical protein [Brevundimonas sp.]